MRIDLRVSTRFCKKLNNNGLVFKIMHFIVVNVSCVWIDVRSEVVAYMMMKEM